MTGEWRAALPLSKIVKCCPHVALTCAGVVPKQKPKSKSLHEIEQEEGDQGVDTAGV